MPTHLLAPNPTTGRIETLELAAAVTAGLALAQVQEAGTSAPKLVPDALAGKAARGHTAINNADYTALVTDVHVAMSGLTADRIVALPPHATFPLGQDFVVVDEDGSCTEASRILIVPRAGAAILKTTSPLSLSAAGASARLRLNSTRTVWLTV